MFVRETGWKRDSVSSGTETGSTYLERHVSVDTGWRYNGKLVAYNLLISCFFLLVIGDRISGKGAQCIVNYYTAN